jgi:hypothetical protein
MNASKCIGIQTSKGYSVSKDRTFRASVVSGWVHIDECVFGGQWVYLGTIPGYKVGIADSVAYLDLGTHRPAR